MAFRITADVPPEQTPISIIFFCLYFLINPFMKYNSFIERRDLILSLISSKTKHSNFYGGISFTNLKFSILCILSKGFLFLILDLI